MHSKTLCGETADISSRIREHYQTKALEESDSRVSFLYISVLREGISLGNAKDRFHETFSGSNFSE